MATLTLRKVDDETHALLRRRASQNGRSMEEEARTILKAAVNPGVSRGEGLGTMIHKLFKPMGGGEVPQAPAAAAGA